jgi:hypothetical protein
MPVQDDDDLHEQLAGPASGETRTGAARLFARYFLCLGPADENADGDAEDQELGAWDAAVACLALSVKVRLPAARLRCVR